MKKAIRFWTSTMTMLAQIVERIVALRLVLLLSLIVLFKPVIPQAIATETSTQRVALSAPPAAYRGPMRINLFGKWNFRFDPQGRGGDNGWFASNAPVSWGNINVPGSYNTQFAKHPDNPDPLDTYLFYKGKAWYKRSFWCPRTSNDLILHLSGIVLRGRVWVDGKFAGASTAPWLDVAYDISRLVKRDAENTVVIEVDNSILPAAIPDTRWRGWWDDGGLIWPVYIEERPPVRSQSFVTTTMLAAGRWRLMIGTYVHEDEPIRSELQLSLIDERGNIIWHKDQHASPSDRDIRIDCSAILDQIRSWSPEHPYLYRLLIRTSALGSSVDSIWFRIGFRQIETSGSKILLNGEPIILRGINRHEFAPGVGQSLSQAQNLRDLRDIKAMGANFVRLPHYPQSQDVYDDCDKLGLLVWTEIPAWQSSTTTLASPAIWKDYAAPELEQMVQQFRNHPSVIVWSIGNEIPSEKPAVAEYVAKAVGYVHQLDPSRLVTYASDKREQDISMGPVDLIAVNEYYGWYYGSLDDAGPMLDRMHAKYPDKPLFVSEFGTEAVGQWRPGTGDTESKDYSYSNQVTYLSSQLQQIFAAKRQPYVAGGAIWIYNDFPDPHRIGHGQPESAKYRNSKGLVTMDRIHKPAYYEVKQFYRDLIQARKGQIVSQN